MPGDFYPGSQYPGQYGGDDGIIGLGGVVAPVGVLVGVGSETFVGHGDVTAPHGQLDGVGAERLDGSGNVTAQPGQLDGLGEVFTAGTVIGVGNVTALVGVLDGEGDVAIPIIEQDRGGGSTHTVYRRRRIQITGRGGVYAPHGQINAVGYVLRPITGVGTITARGRVDGVGQVQDWLAELQRQDEELLELIELGAL